MTEAEAMELPRSKRRRLLSPQEDAAPSTSSHPATTPATPKPKAQQRQATLAQLSPAFKLKTTSPPPLARPELTPSPPHFYTPEMQPMCKASLQRYRIKELTAGEVYYIPNWVDGRTAESWRRELDGLPQWYRPTLRVYGRDITQSRSIAAFATLPDLPLKYSGHNVEMHAPFPALVERIAKYLASDHEPSSSGTSDGSDGQPLGLGSSCGFNHMMANSYPDGATYIGKHSDNLENKVIATVSLGAERTFILERKKPRGAKAKAKSPSGSEGEKVKLTLGNGSLLIMQGDTQRNYTHEIPKEAKVKGPRISLTFRQLIY